MNRMEIFALLFSVAMSVAPVHGGTYWARTLGATLGDKPLHACATPDGGFILAGRTQSAGTGDDAWCAKFDSGGKLTWQHSYGASESEKAECVSLSHGCGYVLAGWSQSFLSRNTGWLLELDAKGAVVWQKAYGTATEKDSVVFHSAQPTEDGGFAVAGSVTFNPTYPIVPSLLIAKLDSKGNVLWDRAFASGREMYVRDLRATADGGFIVVGHMFNIGPSNYGEAFAMKVDAAGQVQWRKAYSSFDDCQFNSIKQALDGGFIAAGEVYTQEMEDWMHQAWVVKLNSSGKPLWAKRYGGTRGYRAECVDLVPGGGFVVAGYDSKRAYGGENAWVMRIDASGKILWQKAYGGGQYDAACSVMSTPDRGSFLVGSTRSFGAGNLDALLLRLSSTGEIDASCGDLYRDSTAVSHKAMPRVLGWGQEVEVGLVATTTSAAASTPDVTQTTLCESPSLPELAATWALAPIPGSIVGLLTIGNYGTAAAGPFDTTLYLSDTPTAGPSSKLWCTMPFPFGLAPSAKDVAVFGGSVTFEEKYVIAVVDEAGTVAEADEKNNQVAARLR